MIPASVLLSVSAMALYPSAAACSTISSGWLAPVRNVKLLVTDSSTYGSAAVSVDRDCLAGPTPPLAGWGLSLGNSCSGMITTTPRAHTSAIAAVRGTSTAISRHPPAPGSNHVPELPLGPATIPGTHAPAR